MKIMLAAMMVLGSGVSAQTIESSMERVQDSIAELRAESVHRGSWGHRVSPVEISCASPVWGGKLPDLLQDESSLIYAMMADSGESYIGGAGVSREDWELYMEDEQRCALLSRYRGRQAAAVTEPMGRLIDELTTTSKLVSLKKDSVRFKIALRQARMLEVYLRRLADQRPLRHEEGQKTAKFWADDLAKAAAIATKPSRPARSKPIPEMRAISKAEMDRAKGLPPCEIRPSGPNEMRYIKLFDRDDW